eukprot:SAG31_NODE_4444_length_3225_cov_2.086052_4_plen_66_part_00
MQPVELNEPLVAERHYRQTEVELDSHPHCHVSHRFYLFLLVQSPKAASPTLMPEQIILCRDDIVL